jgi:hypothetical protein
VLEHLAKVTLVEEPIQTICLVKMLAVAAVALQQLVVTELIQQAALPKVETVVMAQHGLTDQHMPEVVVVVALNITQAHIKMVLAELVAAAMEKLEVQAGKQVDLLILVVVVAALIQPTMVRLEVLVL